MMNKTMLIGRLGAEPEMRYSPQGVAVLPLRVAVNRRHTDKESGERVEETTWFSCVAFRELAEIVASLLHTGSLVYVEGRMRSHRYTNQQQVELTAWELLVERLEVLDRHAEPPEGPDSAPAPADAVQAGDRAPGRRKHARQAR